MIHVVARSKFLDDTHMESEFVGLLCSKVRKCQLTVEQRDDDTDTSIVGPVLGTVIFRVKDTNVLIQ